MNTYTMIMFKVVLVIHDLITNFFALFSPDGGELETVILQPRLRQHVKRSHALLSRDDEAESMRARAIQLFCHLAHNRCVPVPPELSEVLIF